MRRNLGYLLPALFFGAGVLLPNDVLGQGQFDRRQRNAPELVVEANGRMGACDVLTFSADGKRLFAAGDDKVVTIWKYTPDGLEADKPLRWKTWRERRGNIYALALAPASAPEPWNRYVAIGGLGVRTGSVAVLDTNTAEVKFGLTELAPEVAALNNQTVWALAISPSGKQVAIGSNLGDVWLWNLASDKKNDVKKLGRHGAGAENRVHLVGFLNDTEVLSVADDRSVMVWDAARPGAGGERFRFQHVPNVITAALSPDRHWVVAAGDGRNGEESRIVELRSLDGRQSKVISWRDGRRFPNRLAFDADGKRLAVGMFARPDKADFEREVDGEVAIYDVSFAQPQVLQRLSAKLIVQGIAFHPDGRHLAMATSHNYEVTLWDLQGQQAKQIAVKRSLGSCLWAVGVSADGQYLGFQDEAAANPPDPNQRGAGTWRVFDLKKRNWFNETFDKAKQQWVLEKPFQPVAPIMEEAGWSVEFDGRNANWYVVGPDQKKYPIPLNPLTDERPRCYTFLKAEPGKPVRLAVGHYWGASVFALTDQGPRRVRIFTGHQGQVMAIAPSADQKMLFTASDDQTISAWSLAEWQFHPELGAKFGEKDGKVIVEAVDAGSPAWEAGLNVNDEVAFFRVGDAAKPEFDYDRRNPGKPLATIAQCLDWLRRPVPGKSFYFEIARPGIRQLILLVTTVRQRPLWRFFPTRDREWVLWRWQDFFYDTSTNGDFLIGWQMCGDVDQTPVFYRAEQFRAKYHRPDILDRTVLATRWIKPDPRVDRVTLRDEEPPDVQISASAAEVKDNEVKVKLTVTPRGLLPEQQIERVICWLNDFRYREWLRPNPGTFEIELAIPANQFRAIPENKIIVQCYNTAGNRSDNKSVTIRSTRQLETPQLFGLAVGVGDNSHTRLAVKGAKFKDVRMCVADAKRIRDTWETQNNKAYKVGGFDCLCDEEVTPENVIQHIRAVGPKAKPDDVFVLFLAGHGYAEGILKGPQFAKPGTFTFVCSHFDSERADTTGLTSRALYEAMAELPCRKLVLINSCHSGAVVVGGEEYVYSDPVRDLTRDGIGPIVVAACGPKQEAYVVDWPGEEQGGLFTRAVMYGMGDEFERADVDKNGVLDTRELATFVQQRVQELARVYGKQQNPTATPLEKERFALVKK